MFLDIFTIQSVISVSMNKSPFFAWTELSKIRWVAFSGFVKTSSIRDLVLLVIRMFLIACMNPCLKLLNLLHKEMHSSLSIGPA